MKAPDFTLIADNSAEDEYVDFMKHVGVMHFTDGEKNLYYVSARHKPVGIYSPTCRTIDEAVALYAPRGVVIETYTAGEISPAYVVDYAQRQVQDNPAYASELAYAAYLAGQNRIPFTGGEPSDSVIFAALEKEYAPDDIGAFILLRQIACKREQNHSFDSSRFATSPDDYLMEIAAEARLPGKFKLDYRSLAAWAQRHNGMLAERAETMDFAPYSGTTEKKTRRIGHAIGRIREPFIIGAVARMLEEFQSVLVVYGNGHLIKSRPVFEAMLGPGEFAQLVPDDVSQAASARKKPAPL